MKTHASIMNEKMKRYVEENIARKHHMQKEYYESFFNNNIRISWKYTQIVGYVEINLEFNNLKAYYWFVKAKNVSYTLKDRAMEYNGKLSDVSNLKYGNSRIRKDIRSFIALLPTLRKSFNNRHFDTCTLEKTLNSIDFTKLKK